MVGINEARFDDGRYLPHTHGFDYVGTILPFTLQWNCDTFKVQFLECFLRTRILFFLLHATNDDSF